MKNLKRLYNAFCFLILLGVNQACMDAKPEKNTVEPIENLEDVKNESVISTLNSIANDSVKEDIIENPKTKKKAERLKAKRMDKLTQKINASPFKGFNDDEIKKNLENKLKMYRASCNTAIANQIDSLMAYDAVLSIFKQRKTDFCKSYFNEIQKAKKDCRK